MLETYSAGMMAVGAVLVVLSLLWVIIRAFRFKPAWGFASAVGLGLPFFVALHRKLIKVPLGVLVLGILLFAIPLAYNRFAPADLGPREKLVDKELHLTLTGWNPDKAGFRRWIGWLNLKVAGWDRLDYSMLRTRPEVAVLQIANADVDDSTLDHVQGMNRLYEIDLNDTQVTDVGIAKLAKLPKLKTVRLRNTKITDAGFRAHLLPLEGLKELDLTGTAVQSATVREWKAAKDDRKALK